MRVMIKCSAIILALAAVTSANAKGCFKGALIGGVAGHYTVHHGLLGAAAGCIMDAMKLKSALRWSEKGQSIRRRTMAKIASS